MILKVLVASLLLRAATYSCNGSQHKFPKAIELWSEIVCTASNAKTIAFHGIFVNGSTVSPEFFNKLLRGVGETCNAVVLSQTYFFTETSPRSNSSENRETNEEAKNTAVNRERNARPSIPGDSMRQLLSIENLVQEQTGVRRIEDSKDEYTVDMWNINIIFLETEDSFGKLLDQRAPFEWNRREHFIVLAVWNDAVEKSTDTKPMIDRILRKLWIEHRIQNVFFSEPLSINQSRVYSFNPFATINSTAWGKLEVIDASPKKLMYLLSTITYRRTLNLNGHKLDVGLFEQYQTMMKVKRKPPPGSTYAYSGGYNGTDGIVLGTIAKHMNFVVNPVEPLSGEKFGYQLKNGSYVGAVGDVVERRVDVCFVSFFVKKYGTDMNVMEFTAHVGYDRVCVVVPKAAKIPKGVRIYHIFQSSVWVCIIFSQVLVYLVWYFLQVYAPGVSNRRVKPDLRTTLFQGFLINSGYTVKLPSSPSERILLVGVFLSSMTLIGTFNGILYKCFAKDMYYKDIDQLVELEKSGLPISFTSYSVGDVFGSDDDPDLSNLMRNLRRKLVHGRWAINAVTLYGNVSALLREHTYPLLRETHGDKDGSQLIHLMQECPAEYYLSYLLPKNSILRDRINVMIERLNEAGLPVLWQRRTLERRALKMKVNINQHRVQDFVAYTLSDVQTCFGVLVTGLLLSTIAFFSEKGWISACFDRARKTPLMVDR